MLSNLTTIANFTKITVKITLITLAQEKHKNQIKNYDNYVDYVSLGKPVTFLVTTLLCYDRYNKYKKYNSYSNNNVIDVMVVIFPVLNVDFMWKRNCRNFSTVKHDLPLDTPYFPREIKICDDIYGLHIGGE